MINWNPALYVGLGALGVAVVLGCLSVSAALSQKKINGGIFFALVLFICGGVAATMSQVEVVSRLSVGEADDSAGP